MSNREKAAWVSLVTTAVIWGYYFWRLGVRLSEGTAQVEPFIGLFTLCVIVSVITSIVVAIVFAIAGQKLDAPADERDQLIELRATKAAYALLSCGALAASVGTPIALFYMGRLFPGDAAAGAALIIGNGVLLAMLLAEVVKSGGQIVLYRLGR